MIWRLAIRNLLGAGLRTWLNVTVLSLAFVAIIFSQGFNRGMLEQVSHAMIESEIAGGQYWHPAYDPYDPFSLEDAHGLLPPTLQQLVAEDKATPILIVQASIYPAGRFVPVLLKGIDPAQRILNLPVAELGENAATLPALIGTRMARSTGLRIGDVVTVRWRDAHGTFDARDVVIAQIMNTSVPTIDSGQLWLPLPSLQAMAGMSGEATLVVVGEKVKELPPVEGWRFRDVDFLLKDLRDLMRSRFIARAIFYVILLFLALIAIFDTQVLSIFRRRKEIGTLIALGMTRSEVIRLFTLEGGLHGVLATLVGAVYGIPLLGYLAIHGWPLPESIDSFGLAIGRTLYPRYGALLVVGTTLLVLISVTLVSYMPARRIAQMQPTDALRGKMP